MATNKGFTLLEVLIVIALITIIAVIALVVLNITSQVDKARDGRRKNELAALQTALEDYYNDHGCYPQASEICYDDPVDIKKGEFGTQPTIGQKCHICGSESTSPSFAPYLDKLPCDPQHPTKDYLYTYACVEWGACPPPCISGYQVYSDLSMDNDADINTLGCQAGGCGPRPNYGYDYGISSSNTTLSHSTVYNCVSPDYKCNVCGTYEACVNPSSGCRQPSTVYGSRALCCQVNPPSYCP